MIKQFLPRAVRCEKTRKFRAAGLAMFLLAAGLLLSRLLATYFGALLVARGVDANVAEILTTTFFSLLAQIGMCFLLVFFVYKFSLGLNSKQILEFSNFKKTAWFNYIIVVPIALCAIIITMGISGVWVLLLGVFGYVRSGGITNAMLPQTFSPALFLLQMFLIAILPAICEEFAMRGGLLSVLRGRVKPGLFYFFMAIAFGLFHQNITQLAYTAFFGAVMAFVVVKTKSIYPAMLIHFLNNGLSVYLMHASAYGWLGGSFWYSIANFAQSQPFTAIITYICICAAFALLLIILHYVNKENKDPKPIYKKPTLTNTQKPQTLPNNIFYIAAIVTTTAFTLFSFVWGLL